MHSAPTTRSRDYRSERTGHRRFSPSSSGARPPSRGAAGIAKPLEISSGVSRVAPRHLLEACLQSTDPAVQRLSRALVLEGRAYAAESPLRGYLPSGRSKTKAGAGPSSAHTAAGATRSPRQRAAAQRDSCSDSESSALSLGSDPDAAAEYDSVAGHATRQGAGEGLQRAGWTPPLQSTWDVDFSSKGSRRGVYDDGEAGEEHCEALRRHPRHRGETHESSLQTPHVTTTDDLSTPSYRQYRREQAVAGPRHATIGPARRGDERWKDRTWRGSRAQEAEAERGGETILSDVVAPESSSTYSVCSVEKSLAKYKLAYERRQEERASRTNDGLHHAFPGGRSPLSLSRHTPHQHVTAPANRKSIKVHHHPSLKPVSRKLLWEDHPQGQQSPSQFDSNSLTLHPHLFEHSEEPSTSRSAEQLVPPARTPQGRAPPASASTQKKVKTPTPTSERRNAPESEFGARWSHVFEALTSPSPQTRTPVSDPAALPQTSMAPPPPPSPSPPPPTPPAVSAPSETVSPSAEPRRSHDPVVGGTPPEPRSGAPHNGIEEQLDGARREVLALRQTVDQLESRVREGNERLREVEQQHHGEMDELRRQLKEAAEREVDHIKCAAAQRLEAERSQEAARAQLVAAAEEERRQLRKEITRLEVELEEKLALNESSERSASSLQAALEAERGRVATVELKLQQQLERSRELERQLHQREDQCDRQEAELRAVKEQRQQLRAEQTAQEAEARASLHDLETEFTETVEHYQNLLQDAGNRLERAERTVRKYKSLKEQLDRQDKAAREADEAVQNLQRELVEAQEAHRITTEAAQRRTDEVRALEREMEKLALSTANFEGERQSTAKQVESLRAEVAQLQSELQENQVMLDGAAAAAAEREHRLEALLQETQHSAGLFKRNAEETIATLKRQVKEKDAKLCVLATASEEPVQRLRTQLDDERRKRVEVEAQLSQLKRKAKEGEERALREMRREQLRVSTVTNTTALSHRSPSPATTTTTPNPSTATLSVPVHPSTKTGPRNTLPPRPSSPSGSSSPRRPSPQLPLPARSATPCTARATEQTTTPNRTRRSEMSETPTEEGNPRLARSPSTSTSLVSHISAPMAAERSTSSSDVRELGRQASVTEDDTAERDSRRSWRGPPAARPSSSSVESPSDREGETAAEASGTRGAGGAQLAEMDFTAVGLLQYISKSREDFLSKCGAMVRSTSGRVQRDSE